jgi:hypothetical protein
MATAEQEAAIAALAKRNGGRVTPEMVVAEAKADKQSALGQYFTWNLRKAAEERWLDQARELIASVRLEFKVHKTTVKAPLYVRDPTVPSKEQGYISLVKLRDDKEAARDAILYEASRAAAALGRVSRIAAVLNMEEEIEDIREEILSLVARVSQEGAPAPASA